MTGWEPDPGIKQGAGGDQPSDPIFASKPVSRVLSLKTVIYLDAPSPARSSHLLGTAGPACVSLHGVAPDRVYSTELSPADGRALISAFPPLLVRRNQRYISVALVRGSPLAGVTRYPCPMEPGLSSRTGFRLMPAAVRPARRTFYPFLSGQSTKRLYLGSEKDIIDQAKASSWPLSRAFTFVHATRGIVMIRRRRSYRRNLCEVKL